MAFLFFLVLFPFRKPEVGICWYAEVLSDLTCGVICCTYAAFVLTIVRYNFRPAIKEVDWEIKIFVKNSPIICVNMENKNKVGYK